MWCALMQRECVTRGVQIRAAAIFVPELSRQSDPHNNPEDSHFFSYKYTAHPLLQAMCKHHHVGFVVVLSASAVLQASPGITANMTGYVSYLSA